MFLWDNTHREQINKHTLRIWSNPLAVRRHCCPLYRDEQSKKICNYSFSVSVWLQYSLVYVPFHSDTKRVLETKMSEIAKIGILNNKQLMRDIDAFIIGLSFYALAPHQATITSRTTPIVDVLSATTAVSLPKWTNVNVKNVWRDDPNKKRKSAWKVPLGILFSSNVPESRKPARPSIFAPVRLYEDVQRGNRTFLEKTDTFGM